MKSSMLRDMEKGYRTEADHLQGYLLELAEQYNLGDTPSSCVICTFENL